MHGQLKSHQVDVIINSGAVRDEFAQKVKELNRRLKLNGMGYSEWDTLNDRQHEIFTDNLFLDGEGASSPENYVAGALESCGCPTTVEELHHHSPALMGEIEKQQEMLPDMTVRIGESITALDHFIDLVLEQTEPLPSPDSPETAKKIRKYIRSLEGFKSIKETSSSRGPLHIRFALDGSPEEWNKAGGFFESAGLEVTETDLEASQAYPTYLIVAPEGFPDAGIPPAAQLMWVNNSVEVQSTISGQESFFKPKDLTPDRLGLAGKTYNSPSSLIDDATQAVLSEYPDPAISTPLVELLKDADVRGNRIDISDALVFGRSDLANISKDFGEILTAIWAFNNLPFEEINFPAASNFPMIDIYGIDSSGNRTPISVKSGQTGGKVSISNILEAIESQAGERADHNAEAAIGIFNIVKQYSAREQMIKLHQEMETPAIIKLGEVMDQDWKTLDLQSVAEWAENTPDLVERLQPFWDLLGMKLTDRIINRPDKKRLIISPLGESIWKILNESDELQSSLTNLARQVMLVQANVNVRKKYMEFKHNYFKDASFQFGWAGYAAGNKLGFRMDFKA